MCKHDKLRILVLGITDSREPAFTPEVMAAISGGHTFSGGKRHHEIVASLLPDDAVWIEITADLDSVFERYKAVEGDIIVFASGDPLFFGFANSIMKRMPEAEVKVIPTFNSLQMLAHRIPMRYDDMRIVSLTGRPWHEFDRALIERAPKIGVLTDRTHTPQAIALRMTDYGYIDYEMFVGENLGNKERERVTHIRTLDKVGEFEHPNCIILVAREGTVNVRRFGIPEGEFELLDGRERMITKMPIRLLTLQALELYSKATFWDIGFCTGSVSIEAKLLFPHLHVRSFEIRQEGRSLMDINSRRFGAPGIEVVIGDFLETDISGMTAPDAVFIGGHNGQLETIMRRLDEIMAAGGVIVMNSVTQDSHDTFIRVAEELGMPLVQDTRIAIDSHNPIHILKVRVKR